MESGKSTRKETRAARSLEVGATEDSRRALPCRELGLWWGKGSFLEGGQHHPRNGGAFLWRGLEQAWAMRQGQRKWLLRCGAGQAGLLGWSQWALGAP